ncbi:helix-turn-helix domain-containing protein [Actinopolymorpha sp. NPDC004070]|uniref:helix-turn-helix domain-containing protein n=1 Tax=Actinopolymorpha sp. NPDC004070 TaxID=3154548 RepID=UPI0033BDAA26
MTGPLPDVAPRAASGTTAATEPARAPKPLVQPFVPAPLTSVAPAPFPALLQANAVQFGPGERFGFPRVESRMVTWCRAGRGEARVNGVRCSLEPGVLLVLPWGHRIHYTAAEVDPFLLVGVHLVPRHEEGFPLEPTVPHDANHRYAGCRWRRDGEPDLGTQVVATTADAAPGLAQLSAYAVEVWRRGTPSEASIRALGTMMVDELTGLACQLAARTGDQAGYAGPAGFGGRPATCVVPDEVRRVLAYVEHHLADRLTVAGLAEVAGCSGATLSRRFDTYLHRSPMGWVLDQRIERARGLLRTTPLTVAQVARRCGFADANYFSRIFRDRTGRPPTSWRRRERLL